MEIKVVNNINVPNLKVTVDQADANCVTISLNEEKKSSLGSYQPGDTVKIGEREYIVLGHGANTTAVITKKFTKTMVFGDSGDWRTSKVRDYCNGEFYNELAAAVGKQNIIKHNMNLRADDGTGVGITSKDSVSILTTEQYRRYRKYLPVYGDWWWTATRVTAEDKDYARHVCYVCSHGVLSWDNCGYSGGVRPFCILSSSILVD